MIELIRSTGAQAGIAVLLGTPVEVVLPLIDRVEQVTIMSADPAPANAIHPAALDKVRALRGRAAAIEVDGGVTPETVAPAARAGATAVVVGRALFGRGAGAVAASIAALRSAGARP